MVLWGKGASLDSPIKYHSAVVDNDARKLYVFGGMTVRGPASTNQVSDELYELQFDSGTWKRLNCEGINGRYLCCLLDTIVPCLM